MIYLNKEDYFEVYLGSMLSVSDRDVLFMLYQPIIGHDAVSLYLSLYSEFKKQEATYVSLHEDLIENMNINITELQEARHMLEGIGLLQTYYKDDKSQVLYKYVLFAPKSPSDFLGDILLRGLLVRAIGSKKVNQLSNMYKSRNLDTKGFIEITDSFTNVFHPDLDSNIFSTHLDLDNTYTKKTKDITKDFDKGLFLKTLENNYQVKKSAIKTKELKELARISLLFGVEEEVMAEFVAQSMNESGIDFELVKKLAINDKDFSPIRANGIKSKDNFEGNSQIAKKIQLMSTISSFDFLKLKQNGGAVSPSDVKLIDDLGGKYGLSSQVINPLLDYVLENYDNTLPRNLVLKIGSSLKRNNIDSTIDAMNFLYKVKNATNTPSKTKKPQEEKPQVTQEDVDDLLNELGDE